MAGQDDTSSYKFYRYNPSMAAAVIFIIAFAILACLHTWKVIRHKLWYFFVFTVGIVLSVIGYAGRAINAHQTPNWTNGPYIVQTLCLLLPPAFFAASIYMTLGRLVRASNGDHLSPLSPRWMTKIFVTGDVFSFLLQAGGGGMMANKDQMKQGETVVVGGLSVQLLYFGIFVFIATVFHRRAARAGILTGSLVLQLGVLYAASALIFVRSTFRTVEYAGGNDGPLMHSEVYMYIFDSLLMFTVVVLYTIFPPVFHASYRQQRKSVEEVSLQMGPGQPRESV